MLSGVSQDIERQIVYSSYVGPKEAEFIETGSGMAIARGWGEEEMEGCQSKGTNVQS